MPNVAKPVAILASEAPVRTKPSNYPEPFASRMTGREKRPLGVSIRQSRLELGPLISQDRVHANNRAHHAQRIRDFQTFCSVHPPDVHRRIQSPIGSRMPTTRRFHRCIGQQSRNECQCLAPLAQGTPAQRSPSAIKPSRSDALCAVAPAPAFLPVKLTVTEPKPTGADIKAEFRKGALSINITWPICAAAEFTSWATALLK